MKSCENCGFQMFDRENRCPNCGHEEGKGRKSSGSSGEDRVSVGLVILSFLFPIVGFILSGRKRKQQPNAAQIYLITAMISMLINYFLLAKGGSIFDNNYYPTQNEYSYDDVL